MSEFQRSLAFDKSETRKFFHRAIEEHLPEEAKNGHDDEILHCSSVLAHFAQTSTCSSSEDSLPVVMSLSDFFDVVVMDRSGFRPTPKHRVHLGGQLLYLTGFFRDQFKRRHNLDWYDKIGANYYKEAAEDLEEHAGGVASRESRFCRRMYKYHLFWVHTFHRISRSFSENQPDPRVIRLN